MRKIMSCLLAATILLSASCFSFATTVEKGLPAPSTNFIKTLEEIFESADEVSIIDSAGNEITKEFINAYKEDYFSENYAKIWTFAADHIQSITTIEKEIATPSDNILGLKRANQTITFQKRESFIDTLCSMNQTLPFCFDIVLKGKFTENPNTGKILSASITSLYMDFDYPDSPSGYEWYIEPVKTRKEATHTAYSATFVGGMKIEARCSYAGDIYTSKEYTVTETKYSR